VSTSTVQRFTLPQTGREGRRQLSSQAVIPRTEPTTWVGLHWPTSRYLCACPDLDYFLFPDHTPGIIAAANGTYVRLRDHDQPVGVCVALPGILDFGERNTLGLDAQCAAGYAVHHLLERVGEYVPRRHASGS